MSRRERGRERAIELPRAKQRFEVSACKRHVSFYSSPFHGTITHRARPIKGGKREIDYPRTSLAESAQAEVETPPAVDPSTVPGPLWGSKTLQRMLAAFTYRDFRVQWFGACTSSIGTWTQTSAQNWMVLSLTGSAFFLGLDAFLQQLPIMLFTLIGGVLADRHDRRRTLLASQYIQMATAATLALLVYSGVVQIWHILLLSFTTGFAQAFGGPAYQSLIPSLVEKKDLPNAVALNSIQFNVARVLGPLAFGVTIAAFARWGYSDPQAMAACFALNAISFLVVIYALMSLRDHAHRPDRRPEHARSRCRAVFRTCETTRQPRRAHRPRGNDDVPGVRGADVPAAVRAAGVSRRRRHLQSPAGVLGRRLRPRRARRRVAREVQANGSDGAGRCRRSTASSSWRSRCRACSG